MQDNDHIVWTNLNFVLYFFKDLGGLDHWLKILSLLSLPNCLVDVVFSNLEVLTVQVNQWNVNKAFYLVLEI